MNDERFVAKLQPIVHVKVPTSGACYFCQTTTYRKCGDVPVCIMHDDEELAEMKKDLISEAQAEVIIR